MPSVAIPEVKTSSPERRSGSDRRESLSDYLARVGASERASDATVAKALAHYTRELAEDRRTR